MTNVSSASGTATPSYSLAALRDELKEAGLGEPNALKTYAKFAFLSSCAFGLLGMALFLPGLEWWAQAPLGTVALWFLTAAAMCGHDGAHNATSKHAWLNTLLAQIGFTFFGGLSVTYWRNKHNILHHPQVNVAHKDPDVEQGLLALSVRQHREQGPVVRWLQRHAQPIGFWGFGAPLVVVDLKVTSLRYVFGRLIEGKRPGEHLADLAWIVAHYAFWLGVPAVFFPIGKVFLVYGLATVLFGFFLAFIFAPAHIPYPVVSESHDPLLLQLMSTRNFRTNWFFRQTLIGLDHQIEHHLAPRIPHHELGRAAKIVQAYCARHGLPYHETSWLRAIWDTHVQVRDGWRIDEVVVGAPAT